LHPCLCAFKRQLWKRGAQHGMASSAVAVCSSASSVAVERGLRAVAFVCDRRSVARSKTGAPRSPGARPSARRVAPAAVPHASAATATLTRVPRQLIGRRSSGASPTGFVHRPNAASSFRLTLGTVRVASVRVPLADLAISTVKESFGLISLSNLPCLLPRRRLRVMCGLRSRHPLDLDSSAPFVGRHVHISLSRHRLLLSRNCPTFLPDRGGQTWRPCQVRSGQERSCRASSLWRPRDGRPCRRRGPLPPRVSKRTAPLR
jgi:hypothetical protein